MVRQKCSGIRRSYLAKSIFEYIQSNYPNSYLARFFQNKEKVEQIITHFSA